MTDKRFTFYKYFLGILFTQLLTWLIDGHCNIIYINIDIISKARDTDFVLQILCV